MAVLGLGGMECVGCAMGPGGPGRGQVGRLACFDAPNLLNAQLSSVDSSVALLPVHGAPRGRGAWVRLEAHRDRRCQLGRLVVFVIFVLHTCAARRTHGTTRTTTHAAPTRSAPSPCVGLPYANSDSALRDILVGRQGEREVCEPLHRVGPATRRVLQTSTPPLALKGRLRTLIRWAAHRSLHTAIDWLKLELAALKRSTSSQVRAPVRSRFVARGAAQRRLHSEPERVGNSATQ